MIPDNRGHSTFSTGEAATATVGEPFEFFFQCDAPGEMGAPADGEEGAGMATMGSAKALGMDKIIRTLEVGKRADIILFDPERVRSAPEIN